MDIDNFKKEEYYLFFFHLLIHWRLKNFVVTTFDDRTKMKRYNFFVVFCCILFCLSLLVTKWWNHFESYLMQLSDVCRWTVAVNIYTYFRSNSLQDSQPSAFFLVPRPFVLLTINAYKFWTQFLFNQLSP